MEGSLATQIEVSGSSGTLREGGLLAQQLKEGHQGTQMRYRSLASTLD